MAVAISWKICILTTSVPPPLNKEGVLRFQELPAPTDTQPFSEALRLRGGG